MFNVESVRNVALILGKINKIFAVKQIDLN